VAGTASEIERNNARDCLQERFAVAFLSFVEEAHLSFPPARRLRGYRDRPQRHVGLPVVEPRQAAVSSMAIDRSRLGRSA
jgi:hypothetical protein